MIIILWPHFFSSRLDRERLYDIVFGFFSSIEAGSIYDVFVVNDKMAPQCQAVNVPCCAHLHAYYDMVAEAHAQIMTRLDSFLKKHIMIWLQKPMPK